ncbi:unnamed protein product, partial [Brenthis ino]
MAIKIFPYLFALFALLFLVQAAPSENDELPGPRHVSGGAERVGGAGSGPAETCVQPWAVRELVSIAGLQDGPLRC